MKALSAWKYGPGRQVGSDTPDEIWGRESPRVFADLANGQARLDIAVAE